LFLVRAVESPSLFFVLTNFIYSISLYWFAKAAITKEHQLDGSHNGNLLSHKSVGWKYKAKLSAGWVSGKASLLGCRQCLLFMALPLCVCMQLWHSSFSYKGTSPVGLRLHLYNLI
jgi:hypothetical protein